MKIEDPRNTEELHFFKELAPGDVFRVHKKRYYIRVAMLFCSICEDGDDNTEINAISLANGFAVTFDMNDVVEPLPEAVLIPNG